MATVLTVNGRRPTVPRSAFLAQTATVAGAVTLGEDVSVWFGAVLRSERDRIDVGAGTNLQDGVVVHTDEGFPALIGERVTVGHGAILHGCRVGDDALIGMGAVVLNGAVVGRGAVVAAGAVVTEGMEVPEQSLAVGIPARVLDRDVPPIPRHNVQSYLELAALYRDAQPHDAGGDAPA